MYLRIKSTSDTFCALCRRCWANRWMYMSARLSVHKEGEVGRCRGTMARWNHVHISRHPRVQPCWSIRNTKLSASRATMPAMFQGVYNPLPLPPINKSIPCLKFRSNFSHIFKIRFFSNAQHIHIIMYVWVKVSCYHIFESHFDSFQHFTLFKHYNTWRRYVLSIKELCWCLVEVEALSHILEYIFVCILNLNATYMLKKNDISKLG